MSSPSPVASRALWVRLGRMDSRYPVSFLITLILVLGEARYGILGGYDRLATALGVCAATELALVLVLAAFVLYVSLGYVAQMAGLDARSQNAGIPMWIPHSAIVMGFGLIAVLAVLQIVQLFRKGDAP